MTRDEAVEIAKEASALLNQPDDVYEDAPELLLRATQALKWALRQIPKES